MRLITCKVWVVYKIFDCGRRIDLEVFGTESGAQEHRSRKHFEETGMSESYEESAWKIEERQYEET